MAALSYGKDDPEWRTRIVRRTAAFGHVARRSLRGQRNFPEVADLLGEADASKIAAADHMPTALARLIADDLREGLQGFAFLQADTQRATLIDHVGGCERILKTPLPQAFSVEIRRFIIIFLVTLPFALFGKIGEDKVLWLTTVVEVLVAYPLLALDRIGAELQNPFWIKQLNHLPLDDISATIENNLLAMLDPVHEQTRLDLNSGREKGPAAPPIG